MSAPLNHTTLVLTMDQYPLGKRYRKVPSHVSVLPWVELGGGEKRKEFMTAASLVCAEVAPLTLAPGESMRIGGVGFEKDAQSVSSDALIGLHLGLFACANELGLNFSHTQWLGENYTPHVTGVSLLGEFTAPRLTVIDNLTTEGETRGVKTITRQFPFAGTA